MEEQTKPASNKALEVISNDNCSLIVFFNNKELSGMLQVKRLRISISFDQDQFWKITSLCENKLDNTGTYKLFEHSDEKFPFIWQLSSDIRIYLSETEWLDICDIFVKTKVKYFEPIVVKDRV